jgi:hypothetical protein
MTSDLLLNEIERQKKYLAELPKSFNFPLFNTKRALESQRQNGYKNTAVAAREIVDNSMEAKASKIHVIFDARQNNTREAVSSVAFIDNGSGMIPLMARYSLSWGGGTHFDDPTFIGKFGFGLPNASINQTRIVEVYTRTTKTERFTKAWLNLSEFADYNQQIIPSPVEEDLPEFVLRYLKKQKWDFDHGTIVVWRNPDRLTYRTPRVLAEHIIDDFGVTYRYLLEGIELRVDGTLVEPVDPLFLDPKGRYFAPEEEGGAIDVAIEGQKGGIAVPVKYHRDPSTGSYHLEKIASMTDVDDRDSDLLAVGTIHVRVSRLPYGFAIGDRKAKDVPEEAKRRFEIRQGRRGMSFVRAGREIQTLDAFPRSQRDKSTGLGDWPHLQSYAYHWGIEVKFGPELDEVFGIANDKQMVRPIEDFWRVLHKEKIDQLLQRENAEQAELRAEEKNKRKQSVGVASETPTAGEEAAGAVPAIMGKRPSVPERLKTAAREKGEEEAKKKAEISSQSLDDARKALEAERKRRPFKIDFFDDPTGPFYKPDWMGTQVVVSINRKHPFYEVLYGAVLTLTGGELAKNALDVLLIALAKAELEIDEETSSQFFEYQRAEVWSKFLTHALRNLSGKIKEASEPEEGNKAENLVETVRA